MCGYALYGYGWIQDFTILFFIGLLIRILGSGPLINGSGCWSGTLVHLHHSSKINFKKNSKRSKNPRFFWQIMLHDARIRSWIRKLWLTDTDADPGDPKIYWSYGSRCGSGSGSATLLIAILQFFCWEKMFFFVEGVVGLDCFTISSYVGWQSIGFQDFGLLVENWPKRFNLFNTQFRRVFF